MSSAIRGLRIVAGSLLSAGVVPGVMSRTSTSTTAREDCAADGVRRHTSCAECWRKRLKTIAGAGFLPVSNALTNAKATTSKATRSKLIAKTSAITPKTSFNTKRNNQANKSDTTAPFKKFRFRCNVRISSRHPRPDKSNSLNHTKKAEPSGMHRFSRKSFCRQLQKLHMAGSRRSANSAAMTGKQSVFRPTAAGFPRAPPPAGEKNAVNHRTPHGVPGSRRAAVRTRVVATAGCDHGRRRRHRRQPVRLVAKPRCTRLCSHDSRPHFQASNA